MTDQDWFVLVMWGCTFGLVAAAAIMGIAIGRAMNRIKKEALLRRLKQENKDG